MPAGLRHAAGVAAAAFFIALALPAGALAGKGHKCNASACKVYVEPSIPGSGGPAAHGPQGSQGHQNPTSGSSKGGGTQTHVPSNVSRVLAHAGADQDALKNLVAADAGLGHVGSESGDVGSPSAFGAVSDLGVGPTALLAILLASALALAIHSGLRNRRRRSPSA